MKQRKLFVRLFSSVCFLLAFFILQNIQIANAQTPRLEQLIKDTQSNSGVGTGWWSQKMQRIACADINGYIEDVTLSLEGGPFAYVEVGILLSGDPNLINANRINPVYKSESKFVPAGKADHTFIFNQPAEIAPLCNARDYFYLSVRQTPDTPEGAWFYGSLNPFSYRNEYYGTVTSASNYGLADWYFILNGLASQNSAPTLTPVNNQSTNESEPLTFTLTATDPDTDPVTYSSTNLPPGATLDSETGAFTWTPGYTAVGSYQVTFTATEDTPEALSDSETITITVNNTNRAPQLTLIGNQLIAEGDTLQFTISATDEDNDTITLSAVNLPNGATFIPGTGLFSWNTDYDDSGNYPDIEFTATDNGIPMELDVEFITITVGDVNRAPEITNPGPQEVLEGDSLSFSISASDPDGDSTTLSIANLPSGATFNPQTGTFSFTPTLADSGVYTVTLTATDNGLPTESASTDIVITVGDNPTPVEQAQDLIETVTTIDIPQNVENSYLANLQKVEQFILEGKITPALNQLNAFKNKVQQDYQQGILTQTEYMQLMNAANGLIADLIN